MAVALRVEADVPVADIIYELETATALPEGEAALRAAVERAGEIEPVVIDLVEQAANGVYLIPKQANLLFFGILPLAAARRTGPYRPLVRLLRQRPERDLDWLFGDALPDKLTAIILSVFDGDAGPLVEAAMDRAAEGIARWTFWQALARLTFDGVLARPTMIALLDRFERERLAEPRDLAWKGWQDAIVLLGVEELRDRMHAVWEDGRSFERPIDRTADDRALSEACAAAAGDATRFIEQGLAPLDDSVAALAWLPPPRDDDRNTGPQNPADSDPAAAIAPRPDELEWFRQFFVRKSNGCRGDQVLELADGFFSALIAGPGSVAPNEYISKVLEIPAKASASAGPLFDSPEQAEYVTGLLTRYWTMIFHRLNRDTLHMPLLASDGDLPEGLLWATGFLRALTLRIQDWERRKDDEFVALTIQSMMVLAGRGEKIISGKLGRRDRARYVAALPLLLRSLYNVWHGRRDPLARPHLPRDFGSKVGRNDRCPCGSGRKYKRCCGSPDKRTLD
ncbi:MAG: UPF0149 family protein [Xanthobacteraceae bacterium]